MEILDLPKNNGQLTALDLSAETVVYVRTVERALKKLKDCGLIERVGSKKTCCWVGKNK